MSDNANQNPNLAGLHYTYIHPDVCGALASVSFLNRRNVYPYQLFKTLQRDEAMTQKIKLKTLVKRLQVAESFYQKYKTSISSDISQTEELLLRVAPDYRRDSWRNIRAALNTYWSYHGETETAEQIGKIRYPIFLKNKVKPRRIRRVSEADFRRIVLAVDKKTQHIALATLLVAKHLGCRPSEMNSIQQIASNKFLITSSKKTASRGLDRVLETEDEKITGLVTWAVETISGVPTRKLQNHFEHLAKKAFPARSYKPSLYSFRHQLGSNLKASNLSREIIAYIMGHRSTKSVEQYGDRRSGRGDRISVKPAIHDGEILSLVRTCHSPSPSQAANDESYHNLTEGVVPK